MVVFLTDFEKSGLSLGALPGGYPNLLADDDPERVAESYGPNAERLIKAKQSYDPDTVFRSAIPLPVACAMAGAP
jgi:hypothetical protein